MKRRRISLSRFVALGLVAAALLGVGLLVVRSTNRPQQVRLSDGRLFFIEAVTFGSNHVVGWNDWWLVPLRKILPNSAVQALTLARGQSRQSTGWPALVVWVYARDASGKYVDCQGVRASIVDEQGDVYPANGYAHGAFPKGFNRQAYTFYVFPRRAAHLKLQLTPWRSQETSTVTLANPCKAVPQLAWTAENLPATHRVGELEFTLQALSIQTNGGPLHPGEPLSLHWQPVFGLSQGGQPATNWEAPEWQAEDQTGNLGQTLGLHEPILKFIASSYPRPQGFSDLAKRWGLPVAALPSAAQGLQWNTNRLLGNVTVTVIGLFPPGSYTFSGGQLTNAPGRVMVNQGWTGMSQQVFPGRWQFWATHGATNFAVFLRRSDGHGKQRLAVGLRYTQGQQSQVEWGRLDEGGGVSACVFDTPPRDAQGFELEVVLLEPVQGEFVVRPPLERLGDHH